MSGLFGRPSALLPIAMSVLVLITMALFLPTELHYRDEGVAAHLFQLLMPLQVPIIAFFALKWLPRRRADALKVLAVQLGMAALPFSIVFALRL